MITLINHSLNRVFRCSLEPVTSTFSPYQHSHRTILDQKNHKQHHAGASARFLVIDPACPPASKRRLPSFIPALSARRGYRARAKTCEVHHAHATAILYPFRRVQCRASPSPRIRRSVYPQQLGGCARTCLRSSRAEVRLRSIRGAQPTKNGIPIGMNERSMARLAFDLPMHDPATRITDRLSADYGT